MSEAAAVAVTDENLKKEIEKLDINDSETERTSSTMTMSSDGGDEPKSMKGMIKALEKHSDGTNVMKESITTFSSMDGVEKKGDIVIDANEIESKGLPLLKKMIEDAKEQNEKLPETKRSVKWEFQTSPHEQFGKTLDDLYMSFLKWARKNKKSKEDKKKKSDEAETETTTKKEKILNVNKAFRRLESYADWMDSSKEDLKDPLTYKSIKDALVPWGMESSIGKENHFVWWIDFKKIDKKAVKENPIIDSFRSFVWYSHFVMYNSNAQDYGMMIVENCEGLGFIEMMTLFPMKLGTKLDRLTMGVLPVKMEKCYITETPTWMKLFMKFMKVFMSKKLRDRIVLVQEWDDLTTSLGEECIPKGFGKLKGNENFKDLLEQKQESK